MQLFIKNTNLQATARCEVGSMHCLQPFQSYWLVVSHEILIYLLELKSEPIDIQLVVALVVRVHMGLPEKSTINPKCYQ